jgi:hypothetical protein
MPVEAGIQKALIFLGFRLGGNDGYVVIQSILKAVALTAGSATGPSVARAAKMATPYSD